MLSPRPGLDKLHAYTVPDLDWQVKLDANECGNDLPPAVKRKVLERLAALSFNRYPDIIMKELRSMIAASFALKMENVLVGCGSSGLLAASCVAFGGQGRSIVFSTPSFSMYETYVRLADSSPVAVKLEENYGFSAEKILAAAKKEKASLIIICNPNNPTGSVIEQTAIEEVLTGADCPVIVDEAYYEFYGQSAIGLLPRYPNLIVARTFSKAYSLAAARVGYFLANEEITAVIGKVLLPYSVNNLTLATAATVYELRAEFAPGIAQTISEREKMAAALKAIPKFTVYPSQTNFILFRVQGGSSKLAAALMAENIGIREFGSAPGLENCIRVSVGTPAENEAFLLAVQKL